MQKYKYKAININGRPASGLISAANEADLYNQLQGAGLELVSCSVAGEGGASRLLAGAQIKKVEMRDLIQLFVQLEQLQGAGVPLLDALEDVRDCSDNRALTDIMTEVHRAVTDGLPLSDAMKRHPKVFTNLTTSLIAAGEETGDITSVYKQLVKYMTWVDDMQRKIKKATAQPKIAGAAVVLLMVVMLGHVVPQITTFIISLDQELPFYTKALIATSEFFKSYSMHLLVGSLILFIAFKVMIKISGRFAYHVDRVALKSPIFGVLISKASVARYSQTFGALYASGIDVLNSLASARQTVTNKVLVEGLNQVEDAVKAGSSISEAFQASQQFPNLVVRMLRVGEESGNLRPVLDKVSQFYTKDVDDAVEGMVGMIQPVLTGIMGGLILWIAISVFGPIYSSFEHIDF